MIYRPIIKIPFLPVRAMSTSIEAQSIQLHLRNFTHNQITAVLRTGKPRVSRCIHDFRQTWIIQEARRIGWPRKCPYSFDQSRRSPAAARLADRPAATDVIVREMGNVKRFAIGESMVPGAAARCTRSFTGDEGSREVSSTTPNRLDCPSFGLKWSDSANWMTWGSYPKIEVKIPFTKGANSMPWESFWRNGQYKKLCEHVGQLRLSCFNSISFVFSFIFFPLALA
jgi:hypothetical protein